MTKKSVFKHLTFFAIALLMLILPAFTSMDLTPTSAESIPVSSETLGFQVYDRDNKPLSTPDTGMYNNEDTAYSSFDDNYLQFSWSQAKKIVITGINGTGIPEADSYVIRLDVGYAQMYIENKTFYSSTARSTIENIYPSKTVTSLDNLNLEFFFDCHSEDAKVDKPVNKKHKEYGIGWGLYRFSLKVGVNGEDGQTPKYYEALSKYIAIRPTTPDARPVVTASPEPNVPNIVKVEESSRTGMEWAYRFTITNNESYKYCDQSKITWYVTGKGYDGVSYVLTSNDLKNDTFSNYQSYVYLGEIDRNGTSFYFDSNGKGGTWKVYCVVETPGETFTSDFTEVTTQTAYNSFTIILIIAGCALAVLVGIVVVIIVTKKKEKVW